MAETTSVSTEGVSIEDQLGVPRAPFIEDVGEFIGVAPTDAIIGQMQEDYRKYKIIEGKLSNNKQILKSKIPEIERTLAAVSYLESKKDSDEPVSTHYELADHLYANAVIKKPTTVCLWLGANVMVEYSFQEALDLLEKNLATAKTNFKKTTLELDYVREQITTTEVNMARLYNHDVRQRRKQRQAEGAK